MKKDKVKRSIKQKEILYGTLLGDGWLETATKGRTYRYGFKQKQMQKDYVDHVYSILEPLCGSQPIQNRTDFQFKTQTLSCLRLAINFMVVVKKKYQNLFIVG